MSCSSTKTVLRLTLILLILIVSCAFITSLIWMIQTNNNVLYFDNYQLSRLNVSAYRDNASDAEAVSNASQTLVKMEISIRRVEENSRRLKEYTRSLLWDNKDKSLWCILFKDSEQNRPDKRLSAVDNRIKVDEDFLDKLRKHRMKEEIWHVRHSGIHHHVRHKN